MTTTHCSTPAARHHCTRCDDIAAAGRIYLLIDDFLRVTDNYRLQLVVTGNLDRR